MGKTLDLNQNNTIPQIDALPIKLVLPRLLIGEIKIAVEELLERSVEVGDQVKHLEKGYLRKVVE